MNIVGIQKSTTIDYPDKLACVIFTAGCNMRCPFCHNPEAVLPESIRSLQGDMIPLDAFYNFLETRKGMLDGVSICGGEPTLQPDLIDVIRQIKSMGFLVKIDTNGSNAHMIESLLSQNLLDYVAVDLKHRLDRYINASGIATSQSFLDNYQSLRQLLSTGSVDYEYRTTLIKGFHSSDDLIAMAQSIPGAKHYYLQNYRSGNTLDPDFEGSSRSEEELYDLVDMVQPYVAHCGVRL